ncbi:MAG: 50S ribosomal protein L13 [Candidatus Nanoarchaeia archaeon]
MIINAEDLVLGRLASFVAKKALLGEKIDIVNVEKAVVSGARLHTLEHYRRKRVRGYALHGPYFPRDPMRIVKRTIRGMLPYKRGKGREAFKRIHCYVGVPKEFEGKRFETVKGAEVSKIYRTKFVTVAEISKHLGHKR